VGEDINPADKAKAYRWRPAVSPYRPRGISGIRPRKPLPGQMVLPGIECGEESSPAEGAVDAENRLTDPGKVPGRKHNAGPFAPACPNCGSTEFDEDGDCIHCWEPGVVQTDTPPKAREG
jgi:hypothetical protein